MAVEISLVSDDFVFVEYRSFETSNVHHYATGF
jgi:hypothetical protein